VTRADLHLHLLPGVDDGARDLEASVAHAQRMVAAGVTEATVTPHVGHPFFPDVHVDEIRERTYVLQRELDRRRVGLRLHPGGEIHPAATHDLTAAQLDLIAHGPAGARWVLAEVPFAGVTPEFAAGLDAIRGRGFGVVIAHPERAEGLLDGGLALLRPSLRAGAVLQVNACSLMGRQGPEARDAARRLIRSRLAYIIASDGHPGHRDHTLRDGEAPAVAAGASRAQVLQLTQANPRFLLRHGLPRADAPLPLRAGPGRDALAHVRAAARRLSAHV
jgi:protein-tyrosine phosphatase